MRHIDSFHLFEQKVKLKDKTKVSTDKTLVVKPVIKKPLKQNNIYLYGNDCKQVEFGVYKVVSKWDGKKSTPITTKVDPQWYKKLSEQRHKAIEYYIDWLSKPDTQKKLKNPKSLDQIKKVIYNVIIIGITEPLQKGWTSSKGATAFVFDDGSNHIHYFVDGNLQSDEFIQKVLTHEIGHLIDFQLKKLGEKTIYGSDHKCDGVSKVDKTGDDYTSSNTYVEQGTENYARLQVIRKTLDLNPIETPQGFIDKFFKKLQSRELKLLFDVSLNKLTPMTKLTWYGEETITGFALISINNKTKIKVRVNTEFWGDDFWDDKKEKKDRVEFLFIYKGDTPITDFGYLLAQYSEITKDGLIINIDEICKHNNQVVMNKQKSDEVNV